MSANALLFWMSARRQGSWPQFRAAVEELHVGGDGLEGDDDDAPDQLALPLYQALRLNIQRVGHGEFFAGAGDGADWRVTPPILAVTPYVRGWLGIVVGARSVALMERVVTAARGGPSNLQNVALLGYPDQILITANDHDTLAAVAERAGLLLQNDAPAALLTSLPPVDDLRVRYPTKLPFGAEWRVERFSPDDLIWRNTTVEDAASTSGGLFRFILRHQRQVLFCRRGAAFRVPGQVGKYLVLRRRRRQVLGYERDSRSLSVPASCRPPFLVERALVLCSGSPPAYEGGSRGGGLRYAEIPHDIAAIAAALLRQELR